MERPSTTAGSASHYSAQDARRAPMSPRKPSISHVQRPIVIQPDSPKIRQGAFDRRPSVHARSQAYAETEPQRAWREYREELATFSSCIFGNSELMAYKGTSTKVHVVPSDPRTADSSMLGDGRGSIGRSSMRSSRLSQSFSSENIPPTPTVTSRVADRKKVLVTRLFPVPLPIEEDAVSPPGASLEESHGYPFPQSSEELKMRKKKNQPKQKRTPMYAVALVINLPPVSAHATPATTLRSGFRGSGSYNDHDSFPSSLNSNKQSPWTMVGHGHGLDSFETTFGNDAEEQIDAITQHWDIIMRTLNRLQDVVSNTLFILLRQADMSSPDPMPASMPVQIARTSSMSGRRSEDGLPIKPPKSNAKHVTLLPNCLQDNRQIAMEAEVARTRIVAGIRATRVTTGQNRWPIWREEARWVAKWAGGRAQGFFFFNLLTAFLATHLDWLQALSPAQYRRQFFLQQKGKPTDEDNTVPARTIIVSNDKIAARRLIFLLSAFLPASQQLPGIRAHRPSTPASLGPLSHSPPSFVVPILKEESLRRKINRRTGPRRTSHSRNLSMQSQHGRASAVPLTLAHLSMEGRHERRSSDAASIRTAHLPIRGNDLAARKSSAAMTTTIMPETSIPHFSSVHRADVFSSGRPGSSNSMAADDLKRLTREDSAGQASIESGRSSRWGSVISGLWGTRRRDSGAASVKSHTTGDGNVNSPTKPCFSNSQSTKAVSETEAARPGSESREATQDQSPKSRTENAAGLGIDEVGAGTVEPTNITPKVQRTPDPSGAFESPVKTSINIQDGVIDVDVPFPDYVTSFETAVSSPSSSGYLSTPGFGTGFDSFEQSCRISVDGDAPVNVAGWLQHYHPDFILQAVPMQHDIVNQVKASMQAEPAPTWIPNVNLTDQATERWIDVGTALIADTTTFTLKRIRHRRLVKLKPAIDPSLAVAGFAVPAAPAAGTTAAGESIREEFIEEPIFELDEALTYAVERVVAVGDVSKTGSGASSRSTSKRRERRDSTSTQSDGPTPARSSTQLSQDQVQALLGSMMAVEGGQEVPRSQCKAVILSALEEVIKEVADEREKERELETNIEAAMQAPQVRVRGRWEGAVLKEAVRTWLDSVDPRD
ncbi:hypothetical protein QBC47DRAFT_371665 [Echria macrotheca]|uniref:Folliculin-interacting protein N-terminal domain-containing protein n=1 Tax=Echria macrotheca TaxID=438768 RepID=A0AAJ0BJD1_9PEZI|nr:hypothetical protein QBC47DRAFT_371665 [Echria macrotheca]